MRHPAARRDLLILQDLSEPTDKALCEVARFVIRYDRALHVEPIHAAIKSLLSKWDLSREQLMEKTRSIYASGRPFVTTSRFIEQLDWDECRDQVS